MTKQINSESPISGAKINIPSASEIPASSCYYVSNRAQRHATCSRFVKTWKTHLRGKKKRKKKKPEPSHNWFMYLFLELEEELEHLFSISACARVSANTHAPHVYPCACIRGGWKTICLTAVWVLSVDLRRSAGGNRPQVSVPLTFTSSTTDPVGVALFAVHSIFFSVSSQPKKKTKKKLKRHEDFGNKKKFKKMGRQDDSQLSIHFRQENGASRRGRVFSCALWSLKVFPPPSQFYFSAPLSESVFIYLSFPAITHHQTRGGRDRMLKY